MLVMSIVNTCGCIIYMVIIKCVPNVVVSKDMNFVSLSSPLGELCQPIVLYAQKKSLDMEIPLSPKGLRRILHGPKKGS